VTDQRIAPAFAAGMPEIADDNAPVSRHVRGLLRKGEGVVHRNSERSIPRSQHGEQSVPHSTRERYSLTHADVEPWRRRKRHFRVSLEALIGTVTDRETPTISRSANGPLPTAGISARKSLGDRSFTPLSVRRH
jgi:hypothetical protein